MEAFVKPWIPGLRVGDLCSRCNSLAQHGLLYTLTVPVGL